jgi:hypothetical protein
MDCVQVLTHDNRIWQVFFGKPLESWVNTFNGPQRTGTGCATLDEALREYNSQGRTTRLVKVVDAAEAKAMVGKKVRRKPQT